MIEARRAVVQYSGGAASYAAARLIVDELGPDRVTLLFADTLIEDEDLYRFLAASAQKLGIEVTRITEGRTPWQVFFDEALIGNTRADPCSKILKRKLLRRWLEDNADPESCDVIIGYEANEEHRFGPLTERYLPWRVRAPLIEAGIFKETCQKIVEADGLELSRMYRLGFPHDNCGGQCVKGGQAQWLLLLDHFPARYETNENKEQEFREKTGKDVAILRDRRNGETRPLTLRELRLRREKEPGLIDWLDWGGCACMEPPQDPAKPGPAGILPPGVAMPAGDGHE